MSYMALKTMKILIFVIICLEFCALKVGSKTSSTAYMTTTTGTNAVSDYSNTEKASVWTTTSTKTSSFFNTKESTTTTPIFPIHKTTSVSPEHGSTTKKTTKKPKYDLGNYDDGSDGSVPVQYDFWEINTSTASGFQVGLTYGKQEFNPQERRLI
jgi:hypothetical protein